MEMDAAENEKEIVDTEKESGNGHYFVCHTIMLFTSIIHFLCTHCRPVGVLIPLLQQGPRGYPYAYGCDCFYVLFAYLSEQVCYREFLLS